MEMHNPSPLNPVAIAPVPNSLCGNNMLFPCKHLHHDMTKIIPMHHILLPARRSERRAKHIRAERARTGRCYRTVRQDKEDDPQLSKAPQVVPAGTIHSIILGDSG